MTDTDFDLPHAPSPDVIAGFEPDTNCPIWNELVAEREGIDHDEHR